MFAIHFPQPVRDSASDGEVVVLSGPGANAKALDTTTSSTTGIGAKFRGFVRAAQDVIDNVKSGQSVGQAMSNAVVGQATNQRQHKPSMIQTDGRGVLCVLLSLSLWRMMHEAATVVID